MDRSKDGMLQVLRQPRNVQLMCSKCCACHEKAVRENSRRPFGDGSACTYDLFPKVSGH